MRPYWQRRESREKSKAVIGKRRSYWRYCPRLEILEQRLVPSGLVVNTSIDEDDAMFGQGPAGADGQLSLREAIEWCNAGKASTITFSVNAVDVNAGFSNLGDLPAITVPVSITAPNGPVNIVDNRGTTGLVFESNGNTLSGVALNGMATCLTLAGGSNLIQGNFFATDPSSTLTGGADTGMTVMSANNTISGNVLSGSFNDGLDLGKGANGNLITGNFIGTDKTGSNSLANGGTGIFISAGANNTIGGTNAAERNIISGNAFHGIGINGNSNLVEGNYLGVDASGAKVISNGGKGIEVDSGTNNIIGGTTSGAGNVISGNGNGGVWLGGLTTSQNLVVGNLIGTDNTGEIGLGNGQVGNGTNSIGDGVTILDGISNTIGGTDPGAGNVIAANALSGIRLDAQNKGGGTGNLVVGNFIGTDKAGLKALPNGQDGITFDKPPFYATDLGASANTIGGNSDGARNLISGNAGDGINILGQATRNVILGNYVGLDVSGTSPLSNKTNGVEIRDAMSNTIGGTVTGDGNVISANGNGVGNQIVISGSSGNLLERNYVGTDASGMKAVQSASAGTVENGVFIGGASTNNTIGGTAGVRTRNVISGNPGDGIVLVGSGSSVIQNLVEGNFIGTNATDSAALGNGINGVVIDSASGNTIGGTAAGAGNVIAGNPQYGVDISGSGSQHNLLARNLIEHNEYGVFVESGASFNSIGGTTAEDNVIIGNLKSGVVVGKNASDGAMGNAIRQNSIYGNSQLGIDLGMNGVTVNHPGGVATGPNRLQPHPVLISEKESSSGTTAQFLLVDRPNTAYQLDFFNGNLGGAPPLGYGQGLFLKSDTVTTDGHGQALLTEQFPSNAKYISATATDPDGNTSEFSSYVALDSLTASLLSTGNPIKGGTPPRPASTTFTTTNRSLIFADPTDLVAVLQNAGIITVTADKLNATNVPLSWQIDRNPTDVVGPATELPTLSTQTGTFTRITPNVPGSFRLICYLDGNGDGKFEPGEELRVLRLVIVKMTVQPGAFIKSSNFGWGTPLANAIDPTGEAMDFQANVLLEGGGSKETLGLDKVFLGEVGNLTADSFHVSYPGTASNPASGTETEDPDHLINPSKGFPSPMLSTSRVKPGAQATGAATAFLGSSKQTLIGPGTGGKGLIVEVTANSTPTASWDFNHPTTKNLWKTTSGSNSFLEFLVGYTSTYTRNYIALARAGFTITFSGNNVGGKWQPDKNAGVAVTPANGVPLTTGFPKTGDQAGVQVLGYSFDSEVGIISSVPTANVPGGATSSEGGVKGLLTKGTVPFPASGTIALPGDSSAGASSSASVPSGIYHAGEANSDNPSALAMAWSARDQALVRPIAPRSPAALHHPSPASGKFTGVIDWGDF